MRETTLRPVESRDAYYLLDTIRAMYGWRDPATSPLTGAALVRQLERQFPTTTWFIVESRSRLGIRSVGIAEFEEDQPYVYSLKLYLGTNAKGRVTSDLWTNIVDAGHRLGAHRFTFEVAAFHTDFLRIVQRHTPGAVHEGTLRSAVQHDGKWWDVHVYGYIYDLTK